jgi:hypothetical protein
MGKVHGSLARAGKVKSQTPKVRKSQVWRVQIQLADILCLGRATREEEEAKGQGLQAHGVHSSLRERHNDWWQAKGQSRNTPEIWPKVLTRAQMNPNPTT